MNDRSIQMWQKVFSRHSAILLGSEDISAAELKIHLKTVIELVGLRWALRKPEAVKTPDFVPVHGMFFDDDELISSARGKAPKPIAKPREGGEDVEWWDRKNRYTWFGTYVKPIILKGADKHRLRSKLDLTSSDMVFLKALAKMVGKKVMWTNAPDLGAEKTFAASVLFVLDPKGDIEKVDKQQGGLSHLLSKVEKALGLI